ncbi:TetR/AcrR family transcriptional regulator [Oceanimonas sp. MB9]|uniref:TetR/AcrR family transcriptional regulator n=1 Tax=Oceanimonas sp. MB9 TaxID=2588453 RepID=UPI0013F69456|nr:TetR/AcrR family transcriptional regulator [Oceanimonas sp. MB9]NHH99739.1 HTH-type transcriptional regulator TtgR [Oceanimonas sp. MB9]
MYFERAHFSTRIVSLAKNKTTGKMDKKQKTREQILAAAWQLFAGQGYAQTSTRQIAVAAKVATGTVFAHFPTKLDLLKAGLQSKLDETLAYAGETDTEHNPKDRLQHYAVYLYHFYLEQGEFSRELFRELIWQWHDLEAELEAFKCTLFSRSRYNRAAADLLMDCYFMTLLNGLQGRQSRDVMLKNLRDKLALIDDGLFLSASG